MKSRAVLKYGRISNKKVIPLAKSLRGLKVEAVEDILKFSQTKAAKLILKLLKSALANARDKKEGTNNLIISEIKVNAGPIIKRRKIRSRGRADLIKKRTSHITLVLIEKKNSQKSPLLKVQKENGAKNGSKNKS